MIHNWEQKLTETIGLDSERIRLRRFTLNDTQDVYEYGSDAETLKHLVWEGVTTYAEAAVSVSGFYMKTPGAFAIELKSEKKCIGAIDLRVDADNDKAGFGYVLNRAYWNSGYMSEALSALIDFAFNTLEVNRVESTHYTDNPASGKVMEKCGMKREGMSPQEVKVKGNFRDVVHYGILRGH